MCVKKLEIVRDHHSGCIKLWLTVEEQEKGRLMLNIPLGVAREYLQSEGEYDASVSRVLKFEGEGG